MFFFIHIPGYQFLIEPKSSSFSLEQELPLQFIDTSEACTTETKKRETNRNNIYCMRIIEAYCR